MRYQPILLGRLLERADRDTYRGHMPGHKGKPVLPEHIERIDFTELCDTGNLYDPDPQNIIREAEQSFARALSAAADPTNPTPIEATYCAGGSTLLIQAALATVVENAKCSTWNISKPARILAARDARAEEAAPTQTANPNRSALNSSLRSHAESAAISRGETGRSSGSVRILAARDAHRSFFSACALLGCSVDFLYPEYSPDGIAVGVPPDALRTALRTEKYDAVYLTAPNYYGSFCRAHELAAVCAELDVPLIVDSAHAAGLVCGSKCSTWNISHSTPNFVAIFSAHKTLEALGGAAFALSSGDFFAKEKLLRGMQIFGSSSPSYAILASLDLALSRALSSDGHSRFDRIIDRAEALRHKLSAVDGVSIPSLVPANSTQNVPRGTRAERLVSTQPDSPDRSALNSSLRSHAEPAAISQSETGQSSGLCAHPNYPASDPLRLTVRFTHTRGETAAEWMERERGVVAEMADDRFVVFILTAADTPSDLDRLERAIVDCAKHFATHPDPDAPPAPESSAPPTPERVTDMRTALFSPAETIPLADAVDRVAAEILAPYPPGVPVVAPGEKITQKALSFLGTKWYNMNRMVRVLRAEPQTKEDK